MRCLCGHTEEYHYNGKAECGWFTMQVGDCPCEEFVAAEPGATKQGPERLRNMFRIG